MPILQTVAYASTTLDQALVHPAAAAHSAWRHLTPFPMHERWTMQEPATWCCRHCYCRWCCYRCPCYYYSYRYHQHCFLPVQLLLLIPLSAWNKREISCFGESTDMQSSWSQYGGTASAGDSKEDTRITNLRQTSSLQRMLILIRLNASLICTRNDSTRLSTLRRSHSSGVRRIRLIVSLATDLDNRTKCC